MQDASRLPFGVLSETVTPAYPGATGISSEYVICTGDAAAPTTGDQVAAHVIPAFRS